MIPQVIAHRGASYSYPEHTRAAYDEAISSGADGFECDIRLLASGEIICWHDATLNRTSNQSGLLSSKHWNEIALVDAGSWHRRKEFQPPLRFIELLELALSADKSIYIETKHPVPSGGAIENSLAKLLPYVEKVSSAATEQFRVMSFSLMAVNRWVNLRPDIPAIYLLDRRPIYALPKVSAIGPGIARLRKHPDIVKEIHEGGREVHCWTVDDEVDVALCLELGVEAIITNKPREVQELIKKLK